MFLAWTGIQAPPGHKTATISERYPVGRPLMKPLLFLANAFINTFGITQPSEAVAQRSAQFIAALIGIVILIFLGVAGFGIYLMARS